MTNDNEDFYTEDFWADAKQDEEQAQTKKRRKATIELVYAWLADAESAIDAEDENRYLKCIQAAEDNLAAIDETEDA